MEEETETTFATGDVDELILALETQFSDDKQITAVTDPVTTGAYTCTGSCPCSSEQE